MVDNAVTLDRRHIRGIHAVVKASVFPHLGGKVSPHIADEPGKEVPVIGEWDTVAEVRHVIFQFHRGAVFPAEEADSLKNAELRRLGGERLHPVPLQAGVERLAVDAGGVLAAAQDAAGVDLPFRHGHAEIAAQRQAEAQTAGFAGCTDGGDLLGRGVVVHRDHVGAHPKGIDALTHHSLAGLVGGRFESGSGVHAARAVDVRAGLSVTYGDQHGISGITGGVLPQAPNKILIQSQHTQGVQLCIQDSTVPLRGFRLCFRQRREAGAARQQQRDGKQQASAPFGVRAGFLFRK